jgi:hypothetical protein
LANHVIVLNEAHLRRVLREYRDYYTMTGAYIERLREQLEAVPAMYGTA